MSRFTAPYKRVDTKKGHHYVDAHGLRVPGVTTLLDKGKPKPALINWAANATAEAALDSWDELSAMPPARRLEWMKRARYTATDIAKNRGTEIHLYGAKLVAGQEVSVPEELTGYVEGYARLLDAFAISPLHVEFSVASYQHGYAGTVDLIADVEIPDHGRKRLLIDLKTSRKGIFGETAAQLAAYRYADTMLAGEGFSEEDVPMREVDDCAAIWIRPDGSDLIPVTANSAVHRSFLYIAQVAAFEDIARDLIGSAVQPALDSSFRLVREGMPA